MRRRIGLALLALALLTGLQGCAMLGLTLVGTVAGVGMGTGTSYTLDGIAYRTFTAPIEQVRRAALHALKRMDIAVHGDEETEEGRSLVGQAGGWTVYIDLERLTGKTTRLRVTAKQYAVFRDRATSGEIIVQTERSLDELPVPAKKPR